jgi:hypothetical protein
MGEIIVNHVLSCDAHILEKDIIELAVLYENDLPEVNFITSLYNNLKKKSKINNKLFNLGIVTVSEFCWRGAGSGESYNLLLTEVFPKIQGYAEIMYIWTDGDIHGVKINNGKIKQCRVEHKLI